MGYEIVLLDADDTLFEYDVAEAYALKETLGHFSIECDFDNYLCKYRAINKQLWTELEKGWITKEQLRTVRFERLFRSDGVDVNLSEFSDKYLSNLSLGAQLLPDAEEVCRYLKAKYKLVIVTNGMKEVQISRLNNSNIRNYIDTIVVSEEAGYNKPHAGIFEYTFKVMGHENKGTAIIIGDSLNSDILGGINYGIDTCWLNRGSVKNKSSVKPKYEIKELKDIMKIL